MKRAIKVGISLPRDMLSAVERERRASGESRSQFFRRAVDILLRQQREREMTQQYIQAYRKRPETRQETLAALNSATAILAEEPWE